MRNTPCLRLVMAALLLAAIGCAGETKEDVPAPPPTEQKVEIETLHGVEIPDPYRWLEDQVSPQTRAFIEAQNAYTDGFLNQRPERGPIREHVEELLRVDRMGTPTERGGLYFYERQAADEDQPTTYVREGLEGEERVLLDPKAFDPELKTNVSVIDVSDDGSLVAYALRSGGEDEIEIRFRDVASGEDLPDVLAKGRYFGMAIAPDKSAVYYTKMPKGEGPLVFRRALGGAEVEPEALFGEDYGPEKIIYAALDNEGRFLAIHVLEGSSGEKTELYLADLTRDARIIPVNTEIEADFRASVRDGVLYAWTDHEAPKGRVLAIDPARPSPENWRELVPENEDAVLVSVAPLAGRLYLNYLENVQNRVRAVSTEGELVDEIDLDTIGSVAGVSGRWGSDEIFYSLTSFHMPTTIYRYDAEAGESTLFFRPDVPINSDAFEVRQVRFTSKDGTEVPMFLVHKKGLEKTGETPTLLYGYGGFGASMTPGFSSSRAAFVQMGGIYAVANLRGGGEFGETWHRAAVREKKQNTFDDFIAAAEWLINEGYTNPSKLGIAGGSNGGLLVGAAMTQRPELFEAVVCSYPLLDMVRFHRFLVAQYWVPEYGSAEESPEALDYIMAYSPYHNVEENVDYPATLFVTGDGDTRVAPLHARKMAALLQAKSALKRPVMLRYHLDAGHSGGRPMSQQIDDAVDFLTFLAWRLGMDPQEA